MPKLAVGAALSYSYAAYASWGKRAATSYLAAGGLVVSIIPFTVLFMSSTNRALLGAAEGPGSLTGGGSGGCDPEMGVLESG